ncbi:MAG TPA: STELLO glycosyltransferase family protein [Gaiellaceae bacterium]|nr:STELLO glycosyltransferase family protein [Gaiellaceae bacterium]
MAGRTALVVTSVAGATPALRELAQQAARSGLDFILVGDEPSPLDFALDGCDFYSLERQGGLDFELAALSPVRHYARKNLGYLVAIRRRAATIVETDDDTTASPAFWAPRHPTHAGPTASAHGWVNVYRYFSDATIWPRGFPLDDARAPVPPVVDLPVAELLCPIQQGLVDEDPDVDAVYRLLLELPLRFDDGPSVALTAGSWCPFNSQNTAWWPQAYPLMYLPSYCSFRMTDIWRSFVAQRIAGANEWGVLFHRATISQHRNPHDLMRDFRDEVVGYLDNRAMCGLLDSLDLRPGPEHIPANMRRAYETLVAYGWLDERELTLLDAWLADVAAAVSVQTIDVEASSPELVARMEAGTAAADAAA